MVWSRTRLLIWDYIFEPVKDLRISYTGPHPEKLYQKVKELVRSVINVPDAYIQEKNYNWEKVKDSERFEIEWEVSKILDKFSYITIEITLRGFVAGGEGKADVRIRPRMTTEYPQDTLWEQSIVYEMVRRFWDKRFYAAKRTEYINMGKEMLVTFESSIKKYMDELKAQSMQ